MASPGIEPGESRYPIGHDAPFGQDSRQSIPMVTTLRSMERNPGIESGARAGNEAARPP